MKIFTKLTAAFLLVALTAGLAGGIGIFFVGYVGSRGEKVGKKLAPMGRAVVEIQHTATEAHLWLEEILFGDVTEDIEQVWQHYNETLEYCDLIIEGGKKEGLVYYATDNPEIKKQVEIVRKKVVLLKQRAKERYQRYQEFAGIGSAEDQKFDELYKLTGNKIQKLVNSYSVNQKNTVIVDTALQAKYLLANGHLFLEETLMGDTSVKIEEVLRDMKKAKKNMGSLRVLDDSGRVMDIVNNIDMLIKKSQERYDVQKLQQAAGSEADIEFDASHKEFGAAAEKAVELIQDDIKNDLELLRTGNYQTRIFMIAVTVAGLCLATLLGFLMTRMITRPVGKVEKVAQAVARGDLDQKITGLRGSDEITFLANTFNNLIDSLRSRTQVEHGRAELTQTMVEAAALKAFSDELVKKLIDVTQSELAAFYLLNPSGDMFEYYTAVGADSELLRTFDAKSLEGEFGKAIATKTIAHIKDVPEDTVFTFKAVAGNMLPRSIITIPVVAEGNVKAVISLGTLTEYSHECLEVLKQIHPGINTAFLNILANEKTKMLAVELTEKNQELQAQSEELQQQSEELQSQSEEVQKQNIELEAQKKQVEDASRLKSEFLSNMSHELRTPLNSVMALSRVLMMQAGQKLSEEESGYLEIIERNGKNLLALINDILDLSKIEAGRTDITIKPFSLGAVVDGIVSSLSHIADGKGIFLSQNLDDDLPMIESDEKKVHQVLQNIIGNAVKFTDQGSIKVSAFCRDEIMCVEVKDTGIGISREDIPRIFQEFTQIDGTTARLHEGTGLGLAIARKNTEILGGDISVKSIPGRGSTFTLSLPLTWKGPLQVYKTPEFIKPEQVVPGQKTILVVDDEPDVAETISSFLSQDGYNTVIAGSGKEALELTQTHQPFAITLDILMPEMDGLEVLQKLKVNPRTADIPVIIISVSDDRKTGFALGAVGCLTKPVSRDVLISEIRRVSGPKAYSVMVVDDNDIDRKEMTRILEEEKMKVLAAESGMKCMEMICKTVPDVLVLDLLMPEMDGFKVLEKIRVEPMTRDLPVIVVTAKDLTLNERKRLSRQASSVITKGHMTPMVLAEEIKTILAEIEHKKKAPRILLVEDIEEAVIQVRSVLENEGYRVDIAGGGQEALDYVARRVPDGIILDLMMPEVDGFEVLEKIRSTRETAAIPVLILTAKDLTPEDLSRLSANNIQQLIQKGDIDREKLLLKTRLMLGIEPVLKQEPRAEPEKKQRPAKKSRGVSGKKAVGGGQTILIVEDNPDNMTTIKAILQNKYTLFEATDGEEGLREATEQQPGVILLDMSLPKMDGYEAVRKIKADEKAGHIPVIALTAHAMKGDREKMIAAGCDDYVSKPVDINDLLEKVEKWIKKL